MASNQTAQPKSTPAADSRESLIFGIYDRLLDHGHCAPDVVLAPADGEGKPDWENAGPANLEGLPGDEWPQDEQAQMRSAVLIDHIDGCDAETSMLLFLREDGQPSMEQIAGPEADGDIAMRIIGRDIGARPPERAPTPLQESMAKLTAEFSSKPVAANDNHPGIDERLLPFGSAYGGEIRGRTLFGATVDGTKGQIVFDDAGHAWFHWKTRTGASARRIDVPKKARGLVVVDPAEWHGQPIPDRKWFLPDLIPARNVTLLSGDGGVGKSLLALQIGAAAALGVETMGLSPRAGRVFYLGAEDEEDEFRRRLAQVVSGHGRSLSDLGSNFRLSPMAGEDATLALPDRSKNMQPTSVMEQLIEQVTEFGPDLLVLDTSADLFGGDEINRVQVRQFVGMLRRIAMGVGCAVLLLSHPSVAGMQSGSGLSGSTAWNNSVRSRLYLTADRDDDEARLLTTVKSNYGKKGDGLKMRWHNGSFVLDDGKPAAGATLLAARAERVFRDLLSMLNRQGRNVCHVPGTTYAPAVMAKLPEADGVSKVSLADAMNRLLAREEIKIVVDGPPSKRRQRLVLTSEDFGPAD